MNTVYNLYTLMRVDVVLPTLNPNIERLDRAISSIFDQKSVDPNIIIIDDSNRNDVKRRIDAIDGGVTYIRGPGTTLAAALNKGVAHGNAPLVARQDADDISLPCRLERQCQRFNRCGDLDLLGTGTTVVRPTGRTSTRRVKKTLDRAAFTGGNPIVHGSVMFRRVAFESVGGYDERFSTAEDFELWMRMIEAGMTLENINAALYELHLHDNSVYAETLRETKLMARFARMHAQGQTGRSIERCVFDNNNIGTVYTVLSNDEKREFHQAMAMELLRYGNRNAGREHALRALDQNWQSVLRLGLFTLSFTPWFLVESAVDGFRMIKNRRINRLNA